MKKSIILLTTLFFVTIMVFLIGINSGLLQRSFTLSNEIRFMIQVNSLLKDVKTILDSKSALVKSSYGLNLLTSLHWMIENKPSSLKIGLDIDSNAKGLNLNSIKPLDESKDEMTSYAIISSILSDYKVENKDYFLSLILDSLDTDEEEIYYKSEIILVNPEFEQGRIYTKAHFEQIIAFYKDETGDLAIDNIPWDDFLSFGKHTSIDINYIKPQLLAYMLNITKQEASRYLQNRPISNFSTLVLPEEKLILEKLNVKSFVPIVRCFVNIEVLDSATDIQFVYNLTNKRATNVTASPR